MSGNIENDRNAGMRMSETTRLREEISRMLVRHVIQDKKIKVIAGLAIVVAVGVLTYFVVKKINSYTPEKEVTNELKDNQKQNYRF